MARFEEERARGRSDPNSWRVKDTGKSGSPTVRIEGDNGPRSLSELSFSDAIMWKNSLNRQPRQAL